MQFVNQPQRPKLYCGNQNVAPPGYARLGTRYECLRKGFGAGLLAPDETRQKFADKVRQGPIQVLNLQQLQSLATLLHIDLNTQIIMAGGHRVPKTRQELLPEIIGRLNSMFQNWNPAW
jgi:hypothetical protein